MDELKISLGWSITKISEFRQKFKKHILDQTQIEQI